MYLIEFSVKSKKRNLNKLATLQIFKTKFRWVWWSNLNNCYWSSPQLKLTADQIVQNKVVLQNFPTTELFKPNFNKLDDFVF